MRQIWDLSMPRQVEFVWELSRHAADGSDLRGCATACSDVAGERREREAARTKPRSGASTLVLRTAWLGHFGRTWNAASVESVYEAIINDQG
jgi:hypothetical protein